MLNGVGGRSIAEAKHQLSYKEVLLWKAYYERYGSLNVNRRLQCELAEIKAMFATKLGVENVDIYDFMPNEDAPLISFDEMKQQYQQG